MGNIFPFGKPVTGSNLVGREIEVEKIVSMVKTGQSTLVVAPRRYGKTSVVLEALKRLNTQGHYVGFVDIFDIPTRDRLAEAIVRTTLKNKITSAESLLDAAKRGITALRERMEIKTIVDGGMEIVLSFAGEKDMDALLGESLDFPETFSSKHKTPMCFAYDEFGDMGKMNGELIKKMRARFQMHKNTTYIFSGSKESLMNDIFADKKGAFYGFCHPLELGAVPHDAFSKYIMSSFEGAGLMIELETVDIILDRTCCHPYYTQYLCHTVYLQAHNKSRVGKEDVEYSFEEMLVQQQNYLEGVWSSLKHDSSLQLEVCMVLSTGQATPIYSKFDTGRQNVYAALQSLQRKGIIRQSETEYDLTDPLFKEYMKRKTD